MGFLFYFLVFLLSAAIIYAGNRLIVRAKLWGSLTIGLGLLIPVALSGIRNGVGKDFFSYVNMIESLQAGDELYYREIEPLSSMVITFSAQFSEIATPVMFTLFSAITLVVAYIGLKRLAPNGALYIAFTYLLYLCAIFPTTFNTVRSGVAISFVILGFSYLLNTSSGRRFTKMMLSFGAAFLFHASSLIAIPIAIAVYWSTKGKLGQSANKIVLATFICIAVAFPVLGGLISAIPLEFISNYSKYLSQLGLRFSAPGYSILIIGMLVAAMLMTRFKVSENTNLHIIRLIAPYYIPLFIVIGWMSYYPGISRIGFFLDPIVLVLSVYALKQIIETKRLLLSFKMIALLVVIAYSSILLNRSLGWAQAIPYQTIYSEKKAYEIES